MPSTISPPPRIRRPVQGSDNGQGLVEFALVLPVFLLILFGIVQFGFLYGGQTALVNAARETARYAAVIQGASSARVTPTQAQAYTQLTAQVLPRAVPGYRSSNLVTTGAGRTAVCYVTRPTPSAGGTAAYSVFVRVQIAYRHPLFVPFASNIVDFIDGTADSAFRLGAVEEMRVENPILTASPGGLPACP